MASYRDYNSKHYHSKQYKYPKYVPRHHRYRYEDENYKSRRVYRQHYYRRSNDVRGKYDYNMVQTTRAPSPVHWKPTQRPASPPLAIPIIEKPVGSNWKLIADPFFGQVPDKIYRYDGIVPDNFSYPEVIVKDPRTFQYKKKVTNLPIVLPVPIYKIDNNSTGQRPEVEVTFSNLDDNIDSKFLSSLVVKYGKVELVQIYYHPISKKHLNLAKIIFDDPVAAKSCVQSLNKTSIMGKVVNVFLDPFATQCKIMYNNIIKKSKPVPEVHKIKLLSAQSNEEPIFKPQTKEKLYPSTIKNCTNYNCDHATISSMSSVLSSIQSNNAGYNSLEGNPGYSDTYPYEYNRYSCNIPSVPNNHWEVTNAVNPLPLTPEPPTELDVDSAQSKLNLNSKIEVLSEKDTSVEPTFLSVIKEEPDDTLDCKDNIVDDNLNLNMSLQPLVNDSQSDLAAKEIANDEEMLNLISNSKSPFPYKDIYFKCVNAAVKRENEKLEAESLFNFVSNAMHESPDKGISFNDENLLGKSPGRNNPDGAMSLSGLPSLDEEIIENDTIIPQCTQLPIFPPVYNPLQFTNHYSHQYFPFSLNHPCGPPLPSENYCESKPSYDRCEHENLPAELRKKLMSTVINELRKSIKSDLIKKLGTSIAFKIFDQWWEKVEGQLKSTSVTNDESKSEQPAPYIYSILERETEDSGTLTVNGFRQGFGTTVPKMPFSRNTKKESSPKKTSEQLNKGIDQDEMVSSSENETKSIDDNEVTRLTFAVQKREGKELFHSDSSTSTSDSTHNNFNVEGSSSDSSENDDSRDEVKWKTKFEVNKSMTLEDLNKIKYLTPAKNDELIKNKYDGETVKRKIDDNLSNPVESKKRSVSDKKTIMDATDKYFKSRPIIDKKKIPKLLITKLKRPLAARDSNKIENIVPINLQKQSGSEVKTKYFNRRDIVQESTMLNEFLTKGIDVEDINYLKQSYESLLSNDTVYYHWLNETHWLSHPVSDVSNEILDKKKKEEWKMHDTGCARTEGYYKLDSKQKTNFKYHFGHTALQINLTKEFKRIKKSTGKKVALSREARSHQRRLLTAFGATSYSDLLKFNVLKFRKKRLSFGKSAIHDWGLFAMENIAADEMVIEYVGQIIRPVVADLRERQYEASGIGSSYLFRIDLDTIVDATKCGNLSRFINHSCNPNCYAKVVQIEGRKKIVIYSKQPIFVNEEITYDYKFPLEEDKIPCLCGANSCRGTLN